MQKAIDIVWVNEDVDKQQEGQWVAKKELLEQVSAVDRVYDQNQGAPNQSKRTECSRCGESLHAQDACPAKRAKCHKCHRYGHFAKMCGIGASFSEKSSNVSQSSREQSKKQSDKPRHKVSEVAQESTGYTSSSDDSPFFISAVSGKCSEDRYFKVKIDVGCVS